MHDLKLPDIDAAGDGPVGGVVELRRFEDAQGRKRIALAVRSELTLKQVAAEGATWLDCPLVAHEPAELSCAGFGAEVRTALERRIDLSAEHGLAERHGDKGRLNRNLIETLRHREIDIVGRRLAEDRGSSICLGKQVSRFPGSTASACRSPQTLRHDRHRSRFPACALGPFTRARTGKTSEWHRWPS